MSGKSLIGAGPHEVIAIFGEFSPSNYDCANWDSFSKQKKGNFAMDGVQNGYFLATSPTDTPVELYVLHHRLQVCSIARENISKFTHAIIKASLLESSNPQFFCYTETRDGITIVLPDTELDYFPDDLKTSGRLWRAITLSAGAIGAIVGLNELSGVSKIAKAVITPLAECDITVFCISTYQSDFILVQEKDFERVIECLGKRFKIFDENHLKIGGPKRGAMLHSIFSDSKKHRSISKHLRFPSIDYYVTGLSMAELPKATQTLLELMFFSKQVPVDSSQETLEDDLFFHFSIIDGDVSFILDEEAMLKFPPNTIYHSAAQEKWRIIQVGDTPLGFDECGIVAKIAEPLATEQISIYYISTFNYDHALVPEEDVGNVATLLGKYEDGQTTTFSNDFENGCNNCP